MGPQPPLKRRPTYTRPCKRDISAKLTPVGVHPHTRTGAKSQAIILLVDRYIYIYIRTYIYLYIYIHTHVDTVATNRYLTVTSLDIFRPLPTHFHPVFSVVCPPEFALFSPDIFGFQLFVTRASSQFDPFSILMPPRIFLFILHTRSSNRLREIQFRRYYDD